MLPLLAHVGLSKHRRLSEALRIVVFSFLALGVASVAHHRQSEFFVLHFLVSEDSLEACRQVLELRRINKLGLQNARTNLHIFYVIVRTAVEVFLKAHWAHTCIVFSAIFFEEFVALLPVLIVRVDGVFEVVTA